MSIIDPPVIRPFVDVKRINNQKYIGVESTLRDIIDYLQTIHNDPEYADQYFGLRYMVQYLQILVDSEDITPKNTRQKR